MSPNDPSVSTGPVRVEADPYPWPYDGVLSAERTALVCIDWQVDFCGPGGYVDQIGYDLALTRSGLEPTVRVLAAFRAWGATVVHTREGHRPDLSDCPPNKLWRSKAIGAGIGDAGPCGRILVRGEPGWQIVPEVAPIPGELVVDKPGKGAFYATDLDLLLRTRGITHLVLTGITTDVCVHTTMREANDRGFECLLLSDCTGATDPGNYAAALTMVTMEGGTFGAIAPSSALLAALGQLGAGPGAGAGAGDRATGEGDPSVAGGLVCRDEVVAEVRAAFERYEAALVAGDAAVLGELFWAGEEIVRFGIGDAQHGAAELAAYRAAQPPPRAGRTLSETVVATYGDDMAVVSTCFTYPGRDLLGRQQQTWVRLGGRWRIVAAHVSEIGRPAGPVSG